MKASEDRERDHVPILGSLYLTMLGAVPCQALMRSRRVVVGEVVTKDLA